MEESSSGIWEISTRDQLINSKSEKPLKDPLSEVLSSNIMLKQDLPNSWSELNKELSSMLTKDPKRILKSLLDTESKVENISDPSTLSRDPSRIPSTSCQSETGVPKSGKMISRSPSSEPSTTEPISPMDASPQPDQESSSSPEETDGWMSGITTTDKTRSPTPTRSPMFHSPASRSTSAAVQVTTATPPENSLPSEIRMVLSLFLSSATACISHNQRKKISLTKCSKEKWERKRTLSKSRNNKPSRLKRPIREEKTTLLPRRSGKERRMILSPMLKPSSTTWSLRPLKIRSSKTMMILTHPTPETTILSQTKKRSQKISQSPRTKTKINND